MTFRDTLYQYLYFKTERIDDYYDRLVDQIRVMKYDELDYMEIIIAKVRKDLMNEIQQEIILLSAKIKP